MMVAVAGGMGGTVVAAAAPPPPVCFFTSATNPFTFSPIFASSMPLAMVSLALVKAGPAFVLT